MCICVCDSVCVYVVECECVYVCMCVSMCIYVFECVCVCMFMCECVLLYVCVHVCVCDEFEKEQGRIHRGFGRRLGKGI